MEQNLADRPGKEKTKKKTKTHPPRNENTPALEQGGASHCAGGGEKVAHLGKRIYTSRKAEVTPQTEGSARVGP